MTMRNAMVALVGLGILGVAFSSAVAQPPAPEVTNEHKLLKKDVGVWEAEMKTWMEGPDKEPMVSKGVERTHAVGDYWIVSTYEGDFAGQTFVGHSQMGYDPAKKKFIGTWIDSMSTSLAQMDGTYDEATQELTMVMTMLDPATGKDTKAKTVSKYIDDNTRQFTMYMETPGVGEGWMKSMEVTYKKRQAREGKKPRG
jgi:hypothetical protein